MTPTVESSTWPPAIRAILEESEWMMAYGERLALEGILSTIQPRLALEIGTAAGGSLARTATHSAEVHSFDLADPADPDAHPNVHFHRGDSHVLLPEWLAETRAAGRVVDYALVDGDHSAEGVQRDVTDILESGVLRGVMLAHDAHNPEVRRGLKRIVFERYPDVVYVDLGFVPGVVMARTKQMWGGFALIVVDPDRSLTIPDVVLPEGVRQRTVCDPYKLVRPVNLALRAPEAVRGRIALRTRARRALARRRTA
jgi:Methyltransferase domain